MDNKSILKSILRTAIRNAQKDGQKRGLAIGTAVAHPRDKFLYKLISVKGGLATVAIPAKKSPTGKRIQKQFPLNELFCPRTAAEYITKAREKALNDAATLLNVQFIIIG